MTELLNPPGVDRRNRTEFIVVRKSTTFATLVLFLMAALALSAFAMQALPPE